MERCPRGIEDRLLTRIIEGLPQTADDLRKTVESLPPEQGRAATGDRHRDRSVIYRAEEEARKHEAGRKDRRQRVLRQHEW